MKSYASVCCLYAPVAVISKGTEKNKTLEVIRVHVIVFYAFRTLHFNKQQPTAKHISIWTIITELTPRDEPLTDPLACGKDLSV